MSKPSFNDIFTSAQSKEGSNVLIQAFLRLPRREQENELQTALTNISKQDKEEEKKDLLKSLYLMSSLSRFSYTSINKCHWVIRCLVAATIIYSGPKKKACISAKIKDSERWATTNQKPKEGAQLAQPAGPTYDYTLDSKQDLVTFSGVETSLKKTEHGFIIQNGTTLNVIISQLAGAQQSETYRVGLKQGRVDGSSMSMVCSCCINGAHQPTLSLIDPGSESSIQNAFKMVAKQTRFSPLMAGDIFIGGSILGARSFLLYEKILSLFNHCPTPVAWSGIIILGLMALPLCLAATVLTPILTLAFSTLSLTIEGLIVKPIQAIVHACRGKQYDHEARKAIQFLNQLGEVKKDDAPCIMAIHKA